MFYKEHNKYIDKVIKLAIENVKKSSGGPFAAIIVKDSKIIATGCNCVTSKNDPTEHAEINAIRKAAKKLKSFNLSGCILYSSCEPCPMCFSAIYWSNIKKVYYAADKEIASKYGFRDGKIYKELKTKIVTVKMKKIDASDNGREPFKLWKADKNKIKY